MKSFGLSASILALATAAGTGCVTTQPSTTVVTTIPETTVVTASDELNCAGAYSPSAGTNFGACTSPPRNLARVAPAPRAFTAERPATVVTTGPGTPAVTPAPGRTAVATIPSATIATTRMTCAGAYSPYTGTNFGACVYPGR
jgi:hypothetical protein